MKRTLILSAGVLIAATAGGSLGWMLTDRQVPVTLVEKSANTPTVFPGGVFSARYKIIRHRSCATHVERLMFDGAGQRFVLPDLDFSAGTLPLGVDHVLVPTTIPVSALPSENPARYRTINCYECNLLHVISPVCDSPRDIEFKIVNRPSNLPLPAIPPSSPPPPEVAR